jgi:hypothetical protein
MISQFRIVDREDNLFVLPDGKDATYSSLKELFKDARLYINNPYDWAVEEECGDIYEICGCDYLLLHYKGQNSLCDFIW